MEVLNYQSDKNRIENYINSRGFEVETDIIAGVAEIVKDVKNSGDNAIFSYTRKFDGADMDKLTVDQPEIDKAYDSIEQRFIDSLKQAEDNIRNFHEKQVSQSWFDNRENSMLGQLVNPLERIGAYVPGGKAGYPSSVLMSVIPAQTAGVDDITVVTPPGEDGKINPYTLVAADLIGVDNLYKVGGAQAVAGLAYGTETITSVDKIVGPGNIYVTLAKKQVYGLVDIDMLAGPSEVLILADESANPAYIAADLLSQAEHDSRAIPILITTSDKIINEVKKELQEQLQEVSSKGVVERAEKSIERNGMIIKVESISKGLYLTNQIAPEHFELLVENPLSYLGDIQNAGAIFLGEYTPEPVGDYIAGPNHILPTGGTARYASPLTVDDFIKKSSILYYKKEKLNSLKDDITTMAELEGLPCHAKSIKKRFGIDEKKGRDC